MLPLDGATNAVATLARPEPDRLPLPDRVRTAAVRALARAGDLTPATALPAPADPPALAAALEDAATAVAAALCATPSPDAVGEHVAALVTLRDALGDVRESALRDRLALLAQVRVVLEGLRSAERPAQLLGRVPEAACAGAGFSRCVISRVTGSDWIIEGAHFDDARDDAATYLAAVAGRRVRLERSLTETELVRRREAIAVHDAAGGAGAKDVLAPAGMISYVGAPIVTRDHVIGLLHADHGEDGRPVTALDRDALAVLAEGVGLLYEQTVLRARLVAQRDHIRQMASATGMLLEDLCSADIEFTRPNDHDSTMARSATAMFVAPETRLESLLTKRELEVLELMAAGDSNGVVAEKLFISEGTVKTHVKHILRKLRASNRAEAISRYLHAFLDGTRVT
jgi:DNA-binding CsgD family transcriptional regulator